MEATCDRELLLRHLQVVEKGSSRKSSIQVLLGIRIAAHDGELHLAATDMEMSVRTRVAADVSTEGVVVAPSKKLMQIMRALGGEQVHLRMHDGLLHVESDGAHFEQHVYDADDFPKLPPTSGSLFSLDRDALLETITAVSRAASTDESRPVLTGVKVQISAEKLVMVATDSYRLSVCETPITTDLPEPVEAIIPARALNELIRVGDASAAASIAIGVEAGQVLFGIDETWITARRIEGQFPNHLQLIPEAGKFNHQATIDRAELLDVIGRAQVMAERGPLRLSFASGELTVSAATQDVGATTETLPIAYDGEEMSIGFNGEYLRDGVQSYADDTLTLRLIDPFRPGLFSSDSAGLQYLIMPVRLPE